MEAFRQDFNVWGNMPVLVHRQRLGIQLHSGHFAAREAISHQ